MVVTVHEPRLAVGQSAPPSAARSSLLEGACVLGGLALAVLAGAEGTLVWRFSRVLAVVTCTLGVCAAMRRWPGRRRGLLAIAVGTPAIAIAAGFVPHLVRGGAVVVQVATVVMAAAGAVLVVSGTAVATRRVGAVRRGAAIAGVVVSAGLVAFIVGPAVAVTNVPRIGIDAFPDTVGLSYRTVVLTTDDDVTLAGWYVPSSNGAAVVLLHGAGSTRSNVLQHAAALAGDGFGVLMVDARGHGDSGGRAMDFGWYGDRDVAAATEFLAAQPDVDPGRIGAVGISMGGEEAIGAAGSNGLLRGVVAEGATARNAADESWLSDEYGPRGWLQEQLELAQDWVTGLLTEAPKPRSLRSAVAASDGTRYLLITAGRVGDERRAAEHLRAAAPVRVEIWTIDGADHAAGLQTAPDEWPARVVAFLNEVLLAEGN
jgi:dienelactone hydrolase